MSEVTQEQIEQIWRSTNLESNKVQVPVSEGESEDFLDRLRHAENIVNGLDD